jgi:hypothetical protein
MLDHLIDLFQGELLRSVFQAVSQNDDQDFIGTLLVGRMSEPFADRLDRPADCVQKCRCAAWLAALFVQLLDLLNPATVLRDMYS